MYDYSKTDFFDFDVLNWFQLMGYTTPTVERDLLNNLYNQTNQKLSTAPTDFAVYCFYTGDIKLEKFGKATEALRGMAHRVNIYSNKLPASIFNSIQVKYVKVDTIEDAWALERYCQGMAYTRNEIMPMEDKTRN
jgi:hypothetical protein